MRLYPDRVATDRFASDFCRSQRITVVVESCMCEPTVYRWSVGGLWTVMASATKCRLFLAARWTFRLRIILKH